MTPISWRRALVLGGLGAAGLTAGTAGWLAQTMDTPGGLPTAGATGEALLEPLVLDSRDGRLEVALTAAPGARLAGRDTTALGYNGTSPRPTLRVRPGDELAVRLTNRLDQPASASITRQLLSESPATRSAWSSNRPATSPTPISSPSPGPPTTEPASSSRSLSASPPTPWSV
jgi:FtsP/CotA-like multicopper oxidase with cupredoxin domain